MRTLLIGLPGSGKTTFIGALWQSVITGEVAGGLRLTAPSGDSTHLNQIGGTWARAEEQERTKRGFGLYLEMTLEGDELSEPQTMLLPDLPGDSMKDWLVERQWPQEFDEYVRRTDAVALFVHPDMTPPISLREAITAVPWGHDAGVASLGASEGTNEEEPERGPAVPAEEARGSEGATGAPRDWTPRDVPEPVQIVDLLDLVLMRLSKPSPVSVGIVVSAWDLVEDEGVHGSPEDWLTSELPLLKQYLDSNASDLRSRIYGVSAQGDALPNAAESLLAFRRATERLIVVGPETTRHDITAPLRWLMKSADR